MMKQKVVIKVSVHDEKCRAKAMKTAVGIDGVNSASYQQDKGQIEVTGVGIDVVRLTTQLRKSLKYAQVESVTPIDDKKKEEEEKKKAEEKKKKAEEEAAAHYAMGHPHMGHPQMIWTGYPPCQEPCSICTIM